MATINDIGIPGVGSGILQPKLRNRWRVTFANLAGGVDSQPLSLQAITVTRPSLSFEEIQLDRYNSRAWIAGKHMWEPMTLTVEDDVVGTATQVINDQLQGQQFLIGAEGQFMAAREEGSLYKFVTNLEMLDGNDQVIEKWTIEGCWLQAVDWTEMDYSASEAVQITMTIRYDHARQDIGGFNAGQGVATGGAGA
ncbi:hypothetical protein LCGC14_1284760 [marine sediment metagenome]|uniref:Phage tail protein n=1 Tax=marine sediment metagenome TaxID=412755 RepID=A0A0F9KU69_9ZZZZ